MSFKAGDRVTLHDTYWGDWVGKLATVTHPAGEFWAAINGPRMFTRVKFDDGTELMFYPDGCPFADGELRLCENNS